jgi:MOSC domain-containing protein YiiM
MKLLSVNVSLPKEVTHKGKTVRTGIFKERVGGRIKARTLNLDGDRQADLVGHGGEMRAMLVYSHENYDYWAKELGRDDFVFGQFGENFTVEGMLDEHIHVGDRFRIGTALFEVSQPRVPCYKLAMKMGVEGFYAQLLKSGRPGFYFRVLEEGDVGAGDEIQLVESDPIGVTVREASNLLYFQKDDLDGARNVLRIKALSPGWVQSFKTRLQKAEAGSNAQEQFRTLVVIQKVPESETITRPLDEALLHEEPPDSIKRAGHRPPNRANTCRRVPQTRPETPHLPPRLTPSARTRSSQQQLLRSRLPAAPWAAHAPTRCGQSCSRCSSPRAAAS